MELQAGNNKATKDFLSLYKRDSSSTSIPRGDTTRTPPRPPPPPPPPHGFSLKTQDFLCPLERKTMAAGREGQRLPPDINVPVEPPEGPPAEFVPPGGIETYSIRHVPTTCSSSSFGAVVKSEWGAETRAATTTTMTAGEEPTSTSSTVIAGGAFRLWEESFSREKGLKELSMRVEQKHNNEQKPSTPRSKHSATEQRRRSKINDRFQILRDLIPHSDQKRDKASFLLEVIEYIQFLQEKVQKYELEFPGWNQDATCMMPWVKVFFRTFWENARQRNPQVPVDGVGDPSRTMKNGQVPIGFVNSANVAVPNGTMLLRNGQAPSEPANANSAIPGKATPFTVPMQQAGEASGFAQPQQRLISEAENMAYPLPSQCVRSDTGGGQVLDKDLTIDVGTVSISSAYSQGILDILHSREELVPFRVMQIFECGPCSAFHLG